MLISRKIQVQRSEKPVEIIVEVLQRYPDENSHEKYEKMTKTAPFEREKIFPENDCRR